MRPVPAGGPSDKVFPPTDDGGTHTREKRKSTGPECPEDRSATDQLDTELNRAATSDPVVILKEVPS